MKYFGKVALPIKSMDRNRVVIYLGTFSKVLMPGVRIGWVAAMITPDWNPWSMGALAGAMIGLFEGSMLLVRVMLNRKIKAEAAPFVDDDE